MGILRKKKVTTAIGEGALSGAKKGAIVEGTASGVYQKIKNKQRKFNSDNIKLTNFLCNSVNKNSEFILGMKKSGLIQKVKNTGTRIKAVGSLIGTGIKKVAGNAVQGVENAASGVGNAVKSVASNVPSIPKKKKMFSSSNKLNSFLYNSVNKSNF